MEEIKDFDKEPQKKKKKTGNEAPVKRRKVGSRGLLIATVFMAVITLVSLGLCYLMLVQYQKEKAEVALAVSANTDKIYSEAELSARVEGVKEESYLAGKKEVTDYIHDIVVSKGGGLYEILRRLYPEEGVYSDNTGYHFVTLSDKIARNPVKNEGIEIAPDGEYSYVVDGEVRSIKGIDVSEYQGDINWQKVAQSGVRFAIVRIGYKGYGSGAIVEDAKWRQNIEGALANGVEVGAYFFDQAINEAEAIEEANFVLERIAGYQITCPVVIDIEAPGDASARGLTITKTQRNNVVKAFCETVKAAGYQPMIYGNNYSIFGLLDMDDLSEYPIWYAFYNTYLYSPYACSIWQYSSTGRVNGINGDVDMNIAFPFDVPIN